MTMVTPSEAHPETMDYLSRTWCNFAVKTLQPELPADKSIILLDNQLKNFDCEMKGPFPKMEKSVKMEDDFKALPPWKSNDVKSWIWMQQAMHPELNYNSCFRKKWVCNLVMFTSTISVAGVAAALAAIAAENTKRDDSSTTKEEAVASAAALVAAQCAQVAEAMGAKREQLSSMIGSAMSGTSASDILTLTAAAATSLRGAATLKARTGCNNRFNGSAPVLPIEDNSDIDFDFEKCRFVLANGIELHVETPDGNFGVRSVSIVLNSQAKVILKIRKLNLLKSKKESIVLDLHTELYKDSEGDQETDTTCYLIVLTTNEGIIKLDMGDDCHRYKTWATAIHHMLMLSTSSFAKYELQFYKN
ncbi:ice binding protein, putative [Ricinus communis]|uniref:Ice binding protein, putative n=1 Tax=Ricinus communis TaxID=3988 RepID=B9T6W9_RICCO|nr:ice binding protein, putative [Ricinus communis]